MQSDDGFFALFVPDSHMLGSLINGVVFGAGVAASGSIFVCLSLGPDSSFFALHACSVVFRLRAFLI